MRCTSQGAPKMACLNIIRFVTTPSHWRSIAYWLTFAYTECERCKSK